MSVLIKGMDMPKDCSECLFELFDDEEGVFSCEVAKRQYAYKELAKMMRRCPLVEVETPHGDLVDKQKLLKAWTDLEDVSDKIKDPHDVEVAISEQTCDVLLDAPTVIEAEETN